MKEPIDSWNPFDFSPRKHDLQAAYIGLTQAGLFWAAVFALWLICRA